MRSFRRSLVALGVATMLPTVVFAAVSILFFLRAERERVEAATLARSGFVMTLVDARLQRDVAALSVLCSSIYLQTHEWGEFFPRVKRVRSSNPDWTSIVLIEGRSAQEIFDTRRLLGDVRPIDPAHAGPLAQARVSHQPAVGEVQRSETIQAWVYAPCVTDGEVQYVFAAGISPQVFQDILVRLAEPSTTAAVVDNEGRFVARTMAFRERVGTPATEFVRNAIAKGRSGLYRGRTYEGLENYSAFSTSTWTGWSAHLAVASTLIDRPTRLSFIVAGLAGLGSLVLAGVLVLLVLRDMTERRGAEEALRQSQKMEAVGQLTGGIAHDFNNLLTAIIGNLDMIHAKVSGSERLQRLAANALEAARRGAKLSTQLLAFSRSQRMRLGSVDLHALIEGMSSLLAQSVGPSVRVELDIDDQARYVRSDSNQLELALLNLAVNSRDAMPDGGTLRISTSRSSQIGKGLPPGDYVDIVVRDTGTGMTEDVRRRAIEPFFTTKPIGQGTGLGLSQVYAVVRESGGALRIDSEPGDGATICLTLPAAMPEAVPEPTLDDVAPASAPAPVPERDHHVLVVDDDALVRRFMTESLRSLGYRVDALDDGAAALEFLKSSSVDLLLVDFAMPGMNGADVARHAQAMHPGLRVLIVSGYADSAALEAALGSARQLRKPFDLNELGTAVAEILAG
jgi:signal transduction histidine kinase